MFKAGSRLRRLAPKFALLLVSVAAITGVVYARLVDYRSSLRSYDKAQEPDFLTRDFSPLSDGAVLQLGTAHSPANRPQSSYQLFRQEKTAGTLRIGVFGCSFVRGAETIPGADFPSLLQRRLQLSSKAKIEVLNFGVGGYGLQQAYLLWQELGALYDLDYTIFHLFSFHKQRDATFVQLYDSYGPVHARYILDETGQLELVRVSGDDRRDALRRYFRLAPLWEYLRFDIKPPPVIRSMIPGNRELRGNPFYYFKENGEIEQIYTLILNDLVSRAPILIVGANDEATHSLRTKVTGGDGHSFRLWTPHLSWRMPGLYRAPLGHLSALGNAIAAEEYRSLLLGEGTASFPLVSRTGWARESETDSNHSMPSLDKAKEIFLAIGTDPIGVFVTAKGPAGHTRRFNFVDTRTKSLVDLSEGSKISYFPLQHSLASGSDVQIEVVFDDGGTSVATIGKIEEQFGVLGRIEYCDGEIVTGDLQIAVSELSGQPVATIASDRVVDSLRIRLDGEPILIGTPRQFEPGVSMAQYFDLIPSSPTIVSIRAHPQQRPGALDGIQTATVSVVVVSHDDEKNTIPAFTIAAVPQPFPERSLVLGNPINGMREITDQPTRPPRTGEKRRSPENFPGS